MKVEHIYNHIVAGFSAISGVIAVGAYLFNLWDTATCRKFVNITFGIYVILLIPNILNWFFETFSPFRIHHVENNGVGADKIQ